TSGAPGARITFEGESATDDKQTVVLDAGAPVKGWLPAPEIGEGVYKKTNPGFIPYTMTLDNRQLTRIHDVYMQEGKGFKDLGCPSSRMVKTVILRKETNFWDGIECLYGSLDGVTYIRFRNGDDPNKMNLSAAPEGAGIVIKNKSYITVKGLLIRGAQNAVNIEGPSATHNVIENNYLMNGHNRVWIHDGASHNIIRNNTITMNFHGEEPGAWQMIVPDHRAVVRENIYNVFKFISGNGGSDDRGILIQKAGEGNIISDNHILQGLIGVSCSGTRNLEVRGNIIHGMSSIGILTIAGLVDARFHDNLVYDCNINLRLHHLNEPGDRDRREYHYRNCYYHADNQGVHIFTHYNPGGMPPDSRTPEIFLYHNSFSGGIRAIQISGYAYDNGGLPRMHILNNIFSSAMFFNASKNFITDAGMIGSCDYNWAGGSFYHGTPAWFGQHNIAAEGQRFWNSGTEPDFRITPDSPARAAGIDLSKPFTLGSKVFEPLPGMTPGYFSGAAPDIGALQFGEKPGRAISQK
ncbi:MAG: right-handed parallel beta-helix repeat-containing protein, partial [Candidatus Latescibacterota bacterium]